MIIGTIINTRFKLRKDAVDFVAELKERGIKCYGIYHGHRSYVVQHDLIKFELEGSV